MDPTLVLTTRDPSLRTRTQVIVISLNRVPDGAAALFVTVNMYSNASFRSVHSAYVRLMGRRGESSPMHEMTRYALSENTVKTRGLVFARLVRYPTGRWSFEALGCGCGGATAKSSATQQACRLIHALPVGSGGEAVVPAGGGCCCVVS